ncbi:ubiquinone biosynthesis O-methyltransferase, mitochondrial [Paramormyrops kingsleyae]|uniref:Ubiquinone biosynthesis O-methyltransferase, mitochondrial n=1 Tax=Paramormyrops kingsleyae TaxID=1676925 RepID=A0A3B3QL47_9TELE|nr:ubiquinone biosynthesis O-methyltransferase, mitochondrial [Paramormyrops kingsleyae]
MRPGSCFRPVRPVAGHATAMLRKALGSSAFRLPLGVGLQRGSVLGAIFPGSSACACRVHGLQPDGARPHGPVRTAGSSVCSVSSVHHYSAGSSSRTTLDPSETKKFQALSSRWWDERGAFAALHSMNSLRVPFVRDSLLKVHQGLQGGRLLSGTRILDVGCGGGLLSEPLARLGADVMGVDPVEDNVRIAELHSSSDPTLRERLQYRACTIEELSSEETEAFDAIVASEVVEHLLDVDVFIQCCHQVLKPGGLLFITTINKTKLSYVLGIVVAEHLLHIVPPGTHTWEKFISPVDLERMLESNGFCVESIQGMLFNPLSGAWSWAESTALNYALCAVKGRGGQPPGPTHGPEQQLAHHGGAVDQERRES